MSHAWETLYAVSDVHGHLACLLDALETMDLAADPHAGLILLGDYIDRGAHSAEVLYVVKELNERWPERVVALLGNHEVDFLEWMAGDDEDIYWLLQDLGLVTVSSFLNGEQLRQILGDADELPTDFDELSRVNSAVKKAVQMAHSELIAWLRRLPLIYETKEQIFVHAGINEAAGENWRSETPDLDFTHKFPASMGSFHKTVIAGHVGTSGMHQDGSHGIFFDGASHYYIDGSVEQTGRLNILKHVVKTKQCDYLVAEA